MFKLAAKCMLVLSILAATFSSVVLADNSDVQGLEIKGADGVDITTEEIKAFAALAAQVIRDEKKSRKGMLSSEPVVYNFMIATDNDITLLYEEGNENGPTVLVMRKEVTPNLPQYPGEDPSIKEKGVVKTLADDGGFISDGIGARVKINGSTASYMSTLTTTATASQVVVPVDNNNSGTVCPKANGVAVCNAWTYGGFETSTGVVFDMGLMYDSTIGPFDTEQGYKGFLSLSPDKLSYANGYDQVQYKNGYKAGTQVTQYFYRNVSGKVRLKLEGLATCADMGCNNPADTQLITIIESKDSFNISSVKYWKIVSTISTLNNKGKNQADFESIRLDGNLVSSSSFQAAEKDHAQVTRDSGLKYYFRVDGDLY
jgi:hypothetical protein